MDQWETIDEDILKLQATKDMDLKMRITLGLIHFVLNVNNQ